MVTGECHHAQAGDDDDDVRIFMQKAEAAPSKQDGSSTLSCNDQHEQECVMVQKIQMLFIDDIDGGEAEGTVRFALDGAEYEIDLSAKHSEELHNSLTGFIAHARKVGGPARRGSRSPRKSSAIDTVAVRAWARKHGLDVKERGRVPAGVVAKYRAATGQ
jgi:hypothetical protein